MSVVFSIEDHRLRENNRRNLLTYVNRKAFRLPTEKSTVQEKRNTIRRQLEKWRDIQQVYMPGVAVLRGTDTDPDARDALTESRSELAKLWMPSQIPQSHRASMCLRGIVKKEQRFRLAQVQDALAELRRSRRVYRGVVNHFKIDVAGNGQRMITRTRTIMINASNRITRSYNRYRACRAALLLLDPSGDWTKKYLPLNPEDNRGPAREIDEENPGQGDYTMSWIWMATPNAPNNNGDPSISQNQTALSMEEFHDAMRSEWAQMQARASRWEEEYELVTMEMVRSWLFFESKARDWESRTSIARTVSIPLTRGLVAYARKQVAMYQRLAHSFLMQCLTTVQELQIKHSWFFLETMTILRQLRADPSRFLGEWDYACTELKLPEIAARRDQAIISWDHTNPVSVTTPNTTSMDTSTDAIHPTPSAPAPEPSAPRLRRPLPKRSAPRTAPTFSYSTSVPDADDTSSRTLRPRPIATSYAEEDSDWESDCAEDAGDDYLEEDEKDEYNSDDLDIDCDD